MGITGKTRFEKQTSKNQIAFHIGYLFFAVVSGTIAYFIYPNTHWLFIVIAIAGIISMISIGFIRGNVIKHDVARNLDTERCGTEAVSYWDILKDLSIMMLVFSIFSFHLANAAVLPLVGQVIANDGGRDGLTFATICIIIGRLTQVPAVWFAGKYSKQIGYRLVLCIGYITLTIRCLVIILISIFVINPRWLTMTQLLDGGVGFVDLIAITLTKILTEGTGRFNVTYGLCQMALMTGSSLSNVLGGYLAAYNGYIFDDEIKSYNLAFLVLGIISFIPMISTIFGIKEPNKENAKKSKVPSISEKKSLSHSGRAYNPNNDIIPNL